MKKALWILVGTFFIVPTLVFAADKPVSAVKDWTKASIVSIATMHATGKVIEISDESIKIERIVKGNSETMEFDLDKPADNIGVNDFIKIDYNGKNGKLVALRVAKIKLNKK